jgi:hypothetical protein
VEQNVMRGVRFARRVFRKGAPYLLLEIVLPGGTLFALALFLYQQRDSQRARQYVRRLRRVWRRGVTKVSGVTRNASAWFGLRGMALARATV